MKFQKIYDHSPIFFQNLMTSIYGYKLKKNRYGKYYKNHMKLLTELHTYSKEDLKSYQFNEFIKLVKYAKKNSIYYNNLYKDIDLDKFNTLEDIKSLPIITKDEIRENIDKIITIDKKKSIKQHTGGTTGKSMTVYNRVVDSQKRMAVLDFFKMKHGFLNIEMKKATFMGKHIVPPNQEKKIFWRFNKPINQMLYSSFHITEENMIYYIKSLNKFKPKAIDGFVSSIYDIANYIKRNNIKLEFQPLAIFPTSETITEHYRKTIEEVFSCKVRDQYASSEGAPFVWECVNGNLHYDITTGVIENIEESKEILVTSFLNYGTPLIRYKIGDSMEFMDETDECSCGFNSPLIKNIQGRKVDYLYSTEGAKINLGNISNIFKNIPNTIIKSQITQKSLNKLEIKIKVSDLFIEKDKLKLIDEVKHKFGKNMEVKISVVKEIPREKSGKYQFIKNEIK
jgi:phenylacetate-CoA ligase